MSKIVNITDKLNFEENPALQIGEMQGLLFDPEAVEQLCTMKKDGKKLSAKSLMIIVQEAMNLVMGEDSPGEQ